MNLGGRRIKNEELRAEFERLGLEDVACFRASGNVVFGSEDGDETALSERIKVGLGEALGYEVPVFLRGAVELRAVAAHQPFDAGALDASKGKLQVAFLADTPMAAAGKKALTLATDEDRLEIEGRELYWLPSGGISASALELKAIEAAVGPWTMRTTGTIEQIVLRYFDEQQA